MTPHIFVRPGELRRAEWSEVDAERAVWSIPTEDAPAESDAAVAAGARLDRQDTAADRPQTLFLSGLA